MKDRSGCQDDKDQAPLVTGGHEAEGEGADRAANVGPDDANPLQTDEQTARVRRINFTHIHRAVGVYHASTDSAENSGKQQHPNVDRSGLECARDDGDGSRSGVGQFASKFVRNWRLDKSLNKCSAQEAMLNASVIVVRIVVARGFVKILTRPGDRQCAPWHLVCSRTPH